MQERSLGYPISSRNSSTLSVLEDPREVVYASIEIVLICIALQYLFEENKKGFFEKLDKITKKNGIVYINVFVEKPFLELPMIK